MLLSAYEAATQQLIQALTSSLPLIDKPTLDLYINQARDQVAGDGECVVAFPATLVVTPAVQSYGFSAIVLPPAAPQGIGPVLTVRQASFQIGTGPGAGAVLTYPRAWPWFKLYTLDVTVPQPGPPREYAIFGQGTAGTLWVPFLDTVYTLNLDVVCLPIPLVDDTTPDAIPQLWDQAVPFCAAWLGMQNAQRQADADMMMQRYKEMMGRARGFATPQQLPGLASQAPDIVMQNRYGLSGGGGGPGA